MLSSVPLPAAHLPFFLIPSPKSVILSTSSVSFIHKHKPFLCLTLLLSISLPTLSFLRQELEKIKWSLFMAKSKNNVKNVSYISVPSQIINSLSCSLQALLFSQQNPSRNKFSGFNYAYIRSTRVWFFALFLFSILCMLKLWFNLDPNLLIFATSYPCLTSTTRDTFSSTIIHGQLGSDHNGSNNDIKDLSFKGNITSGGEFWKQPDGMGYRACLKFSEEYRTGSEVILRNRGKYLLVVVSGGMNQQRNQIVDAVVIARILGATLVVPVLQVNLIWGDESEFSDIFDLAHFKRVLRNDVRVVSSLPSTHIMTRPVEEKRTPHNASLDWIRSRYLKRINREGVLLLRGLDSRLSKDLPSDLQKLRCKVAFHALKFAPRILELANRLVERMRSKGPYIALHLRLEKDVWMRTGCLPGLSHEYDEMINNERKKHPELLTARSNMSYHNRKLFGLCPLNAVEVTRLLKALGAPKDARIYWAGGQPLGGKEALLPLMTEFPYIYNKEDLALPGELEPFAKQASFMAAIDYIVSVNSDVFMPSHGGNMGHTIQGQRAYAGHKKYITPNKRQMLPYFLNSSLPEAEFNIIIRELHSESLGGPELKTSKAERDVTKYPVHECMCNDSQAHSSV